jgi:hypothetical protein
VGQRVNASRPLEGGKGCIRPSSMSNNAPPRIVGQGRGTAISRKPVPRNPRHVRSEARIGQSGPRRCGCSSARTTMSHRCPHRWWWTCARCRSCRSFVLLGGVQHSPTWGRFQFRHNVARPCLLVRGRLHNVSYDFGSVTGLAFVLPPVSLSFRRRMVRSEDRNQTNDHENHHVDRSENPR